MSDEIEQENNYPDLSVQKVGAAELCVGFVLFGVFTFIHEGLLKFGSIGKFESIFVKLEVDLPILTQFYVGLGDVLCLIIMFMLTIIPICILLVGKKASPVIFYVIIGCVIVEVAFIMLGVHAMMLPLLKIIERLN